MKRRFIFILLLLLLCSPISVCTANTKVPVLKSVKFYSSNIHYILKDAVRFDGVEVSLFDLTTNKVLAWGVSTKKKNSFSAGSAIEMPCYVRARYFTYGINGTKKYYGYSKKSYILPGVTIAKSRTTVNVDKIDLYWEALGCASSYQVQLKKSTGKWKTVTNTQDTNCKFSFRGGSSSNVRVRVLAKSVINGRTIKSSGDPGIRPIDIIL